MPAHFCNVDLDIESRFDLAPMEKELGRKVSVLAGGPVSPGCFLLRLETATHYQNPDDTIMAFCALLERLSPKAKRLWRSAHKKEFDIGYETARDKRASQFSLRTESLKRISHVGATLGATFYNHSFVSHVKRRRVKQS
jgi:hypothetical protein